MKNLVLRVNELINIADKIIALAPVNESIRISREIFNEFRTASLSFIRIVYGEKHPYYIEFDTKINENWTYTVGSGRGILKAIKNEIEGGWLISLKGLVSAELFSNFLEMAEHLLQEKYKDPAAVIIGSVLEEHLRQLCIKNGLSIDESRWGKILSKKADQLNNELASNLIYNKLDQKNVTAWLDLRNKAAHGKYSEYNHDQVQYLLQNVTEFISRNKI